jgi:uncharacterized protein with NAD-binding domain and iron-sulfur cluster
MKKSDNTPAGRSSVENPDNMTKSKRGFTRRKFVVGAGVGVGAVAGAGALAVPLARSPYSVRYPVVKQNHADLPSNGKSVVIVGGGLAGLQAGVELSSRGFKVTVLEKTGLPGGKLKTWRDRNFGPDDDPRKRDPNFKGYVREHGIHAIWGFYNNLREFLHRHGWGLQKLPEDMSMYYFLDKDGTRSEMKISDWPAPYSSIQQAFYSLDIKHVHEKDREALGELFSKLASFDYADPKQRAYLDSMTFEEYGKKLGLSDEIIYKLIDSLLEMAYFDNVDRTSALSMATLVQLLAGSPEDMKIELYMNPPGETFLEPMVEHIRKRGGAVHYNTEVTDIGVDDGKMSSVRTTQLTEKGVRRCSVCGALIVDGVELSHCPFCGANGDMIVVLQDEDKQERRFEADYYVCALDIPAAQKLVGKNLSALGDSTYFNNILDLHATSVFVVNFWVEGLGAWNDALLQKDGKSAMDFFATGFDHLGITLNWSHPIDLGDGNDFYIMDQYRGRQLSIIETQIAKADNVAHLSNEEIADRCYEELKTAIPDLPPYRDFFINRWHHYTGYYPGDEGRRPPLQSPIDNLLFIGDLAFVPHPAIFMEKTNVTAKWATNLLLEKIGQQEGTIEILPSGTPGVIVDMMRGRNSVFV